MDGITDSTDMSLTKFQEMVKYREAWCAAVHRAAKSRTRLSDFTLLLLTYFFVVKMRCPEQGAIGGWVMLCLVFKWFCLCEFSLFDTSRVSSLVA